MNRPTVVQQYYSAPGISDHEIAMVTVKLQHFVILFFFRVIFIVCLPIVMLTHVSPTII